MQNKILGALSIIVIIVAFFLAFKAIPKEEEVYIEEYTVTPSVDVSEISEGMTMEEVKKELGEPREIHVSDIEGYNSEIWFYGGATIVFVDNLVQQMASL